MSVDYRLAVYDHIKNTAYTVEQVFSGLADRTERFSPLDETFCSRLGCTSMEYTIPAIHPLFGTPPDTTEIHNFGRFGAEAALHVPSKPCASGAAYVMGVTTIEASPQFVDQRLIHVPLTTHRVYSAHFKPQEGITLGLCSIVQRELPDQSVKVAEERLLSDVSLDRLRAHTATAYRVLRQHCSIIRALS